MFMEFDYTLNINEHTVHGLHKMIENVPSAIEAATVTPRHSMTFLLVKFFLSPTMGRVRMPLPS